MRVVTLLKAAASKVLVIWLETGVDYCGGLKGVMQASIISRRLKKPW